MKTHDFKIYAVPSKNDDGTISESFRVVCPDDLDGYRETRPIYFPTLQEAEEWVRVQLIPEPPARLIKRIPAKPSKAQRQREAIDAELRIQSDYDAAIRAHEKREPYILAAITILTIVVIFLLFA